MLLLIRQRSVYGLSEGSLTFLVPTVLSIGGRLCDNMHLKKDEIAILLVLGRRMVGGERSLSKSKMFTVKTRGSLHGKSRMLNSWHGELQPRYPLIEQSHLIGHRILLVSSVDVCPERERLTNSGARAFRHSSRHTAAYSCTKFICSHVPN